MAYGSKINTTDEGIIPIGSSLYGTCTSGASTVAKVVTMANFDVLTVGVTIHVHFTYGNTASNPTLKVGSTSALPIYYNGSAGGTWEDGAFISFTYYSNAWHQNDVQESNGSSLTAGNGLTIISPNTMRLAYSVGDVIVTATNTNPSAHYGGTWTQIDKKFSPSWGSDGITWNATNTTTTRTFDWIRTDHDIWIRVRWANRVAFSDSTLIIGTINMATLGFQSGTAGYYQHFAGFCDGANAALQMYLSWSGSTATLQVLDAVTRATSYPTTTGQDCYAVTTVKCHPNHMADSACNQFFWQRTA